MRLIALPNRYWIHLFRMGDMSYGIRDGPKGRLYLIAQPNMQAGAKGMISGVRRSRAAAKEYSDWSTLAPNSLVC